MRLQCLFHLGGACLENLQQVSVTPLEVLEHFRQLSRCSPGLEPKNSADDMIGSRLVGRVEISGFSRRLEGSDDDSRGIWSQV